MTWLHLTIRLLVLISTPLVYGAVQKSPPADFKEGPPLILGQGEQRILRIEGLSKFSIGSDIVRSHPLPTPNGRKIPGAESKLLLKGVRPGASDLWIWKTDGTSEYRAVHVEKSTLEAPSSALDRALSRLEEVEILRSGTGIILRGEILSSSEGARVAAIAQGFSKEVHDETEAALPYLDDSQTRLQAWLRTSTYSTRLRIERVDRNIWLRGSIERPNEQDAVRRRAKAIFPLIQFDVESLPDAAPTVHFKVFLLELKRSGFTRLGVEWPIGQEGAFSLTTRGLQNLLKLDLAVHALEGEGLLKVLSNPELVVRAPGEAELFAGGEIPIKVESRFSANVSWKKYGLILNLKVTHVAGDKIRLDISTEVSHLDLSISTDGKIPGLQANRMKTQVDARYQVPLLLSGLLQQDMREEARGLPFLRRIPILGALFGSDDYLNERSELVAILLPSGTPPPAPMHHFHALSPRGAVPPPRNWVDPREEQALRESPNYPWNALQ